MRLGEKLHQLRPHISCEAIIMQEAAFLEKVNCMNIDYGHTITLKPYSGKLFLIFLYQKTRDSESSSE